MTENALTAPIDTQLIEKVVIGGDLSKLSATQRMDYYSAVCNSLGLNPLTRPFDYINLNGKLTLYAKRDAADQLRKIHHISIGKPDVNFTDDMVIVSVTGTDRTGRTDSDLGVVYIGKKTGDPKANAILKAITKAKRRLTLSLVGLGWLDETEIETIPSARPVAVPEMSGSDPDHAADIAEAQRELESIDPPQEARGTILVSPDVKITDLGYVPDWLEDDEPRPGSQWGRLLFEAREHLGYDNDHHVRATLSKLFDDYTEKSYKAAWAVLVGHKRAKLEDEQPSKPTD